jgi:hypothetical protein
MKIATLTPTRNDREEFANECVLMMENQTIKVDIHLIDFEPTDAKKDISKRYRIGYEKLKNKYDLIFLIEDDDYYCPTYIEYMIDFWRSYGEPDLLGLNHTTYYHLGLKKWFVMNHDVRSSAMNTMLKGGLKIDYPKDEDPYFDLHLWFNNTHLSKQIVHIKEDICIGIKHGIGLCGGNNHTNQLDRFINDDSDLEWLKSKTDLRMFEFYKSF